MRRTLVVGDDLHSARSHDAHARVRRAEVDADGRRLGLRHDLGQEKRTKGEAESALISGEGKAAGGRSGAASRGCRDNERGRPAFKRVDVRQ